MRVSQKMKDSPWGKEIRWSKMDGGKNWGMKKSRCTSSVTLLMSLEGVTKDIKDERQRMEKRDTVV